MGGARTVRSADGTTIALEERGAGDPLVLVEPPLSDRRSPVYAGLADLLASSFTVVRYDRRGRGESGDVAPYSPAKEVADLAAVLDAVGGRAHLYGYSGGALLALHAAAVGLPVRSLVVLEPPLHDPGHDFTQPDPLTVALADLVDNDRREEAVLHFHRCIGVPEEFVAAMVGAPGWDEKAAMAHTLVYDCRISDATTPEVLATVEVPTLVLDSAGSTDDLSAWAADVAARIPGARHRSLPGEWHTVADDVLAPVLVQFFAAAD